MKIDTIPTNNRVPTLSATSAEPGGTTASIDTGTEIQNGSSGSDANETGQVGKSFSRVLSDRMNADSPAPVPSTTTATTKPESDDDHRRPVQQDHSGDDSVNPALPFPVMISPPPQLQVPLPASTKPVTGDNTVPQLNPTPVAVSTPIAVSTPATLPATSPVPVAVNAPRVPVPSSVAEVAQKLVKQPTTVTAVSMVEDIQRQTVKTSAEKPSVPQMLISDPVTTQFASTNLVNEAPPSLPSANVTSVPVEVDAAKPPLAVPNAVPPNSIRVPKPSSFNNTLLQVAAVELPSAATTPQSIGPAVSPTPWVDPRAALISLSQPRNDFPATQTSGTVSSDDASQFAVFPTAGTGNSMAGDVSQVVEATASPGDSPINEIHRADSDGPTHVDDASGTRVPEIVPAASQSNSTPIPLNSLADRLTEIVMDRRDNAQGGDQATVVLRLDPPELGRVNVHVSMSNDVVSIHMVASDDMARQAIERQLSDLQASLTNQGISFNQCQVDCDARGQSSKHGMKQQTLDDYQSVPLSGRRMAGFAPAISTRTTALSQLDYVA